MDDKYTSTECPHCGSMAIRGTQAASEYRAEECECPNGHVWIRQVVTDPFPSAPTYEELENMRGKMEDYDDIVEFSRDNEDWYNAAPYVAARFIVRVAREHDGFRERLLETDEVGVAHEMSQYDEETHSKLNSMGLSAFQGGHAENLARQKLRGGR